MKWTLATILVISLAAAATHGAVATTRRPACGQGFILSRDKCIRSASNQATPPPPPPPVTSSQRSQPVPHQQPTAPFAGNQTINCAAGQKLKDGKCTFKQCPVGWTLNSAGKCDCLQGSNKINNRCVNPNVSTPQKTCPQGHELNAQGKCSPRPTPPPQPCPSGQRRNRKGHCIPVVVGHSCGAGLWIDERGNCGPHNPNDGCPAGKERNGMGNCVKVQVCLPGQVKGRTGVCQPASCPSGKEMKNGECVDASINNINRG